VSRGLGGVLCTYFTTKAAVSIIPSTLLSGNLCVSQVEFCFLAQIYRTSLLSNARGRSVPRGRPRYHVAVKDTHGRVPENFQQKINSQFTRQESKVTFHVRLTVSRQASLAQFWHSECMLTAAALICACTARLFSFNRNVARLAGFGPHIHGLSPRCLVTPTRVVPCLPTSIQASDRVRLGSVHLGGGTVGTSVGMADLTAWQRRHKSYEEDLAKSGGWTNQAR